MDGNSMSSRPQASTARPRPAIPPVIFRDACAFVAEHHQHHSPPQGHRFSLGVGTVGQLVGNASGA
jgi:hypothetical protein